jgi:hypothetical protein
MFGEIIQSNRYSLTKQKNLNSTFYIIISNFMMKSENSDGQDEEVEQQNLYTTIKRMHKFYPVFKVINKPPL